MNFLKKYLAFLIIFKDLWGNCQAISGVINTLINQKLEEFQNGNHDFLKMFATFSILFDEVWGNY